VNSKDGISNLLCCILRRTKQEVLSVQKVLSGSGGGRLRTTGIYICHRLVVRPEPDNTLWTVSRKHVT